MKKEVTPEDLEVNVLYMLTQTFDLILRDIEWRMAERGRREEGRAVEFKREKKKMFREYLDGIGDICKRCKKSFDQNEKITQDIYDSSASSNYSSVPIWQMESNELARLILMYADKSADADKVNKIHSFLRSIPGEGIVTEEVLKNFYLKK